MEALVIAVQLNVGADVPTWRADEDLRIGSMDGGPSAFGSVIDVEVNGRGDIFVLDGQAAQIPVFTAQGGFLRTLGRRGQGPGEFQSFREAGWKGDTLWVVDPQASRVTMMSEADSVFATITIRSSVALEGAAVGVRPGPLLADGSVLAYGSGTAYSLSGAVSPRLPIYRTDRGADSLHVLMTFDASKEFMVYGAGSMLRQPVSDRKLFAVARDGRSLWYLDRSVSGPDPPGRTWLTNTSISGDTLSHHSIAYEPVPFDDGHFNALVDSVVGAARDTGVPEQFVETMREALQESAFRPSHHPPATHLVAGSDSTVWLRLQQPEVSEAAQWLVFSAAGAMIARLHLPQGLQMHRATLQTIWGSMVGPFDEPYVVRLRVSREWPATRRASGPASGRTGGARPSTCGTRSRSLGRPPTASRRLPRPRG